MNARPITPKGKARLANAMLRAHRKGRRAAGIAIEHRATGFYGLPDAERAGWLGVVDWHLKQLTGGPAK